jgi:hypothetical protein
LHIDQSDPRLPLVTTLTSDIASRGSVVVYHKSFEASQLRKLAEKFPDYGSKLAAIADRLWDLEDIFKHRYKHPAFRGSTSIKNVLPVLVPSLSYKELAIQRGDAAQTLWNVMISCTNTAQKSRMIENLRAYCKLDTLAMVEIYQALLQLTKQP